MKTQKIIKNQTPIAIDLHLKYRCPNSECSAVHWLSLAETRTKQFKVVCYCGSVFSPKKISKIKIQYEKKHKTKHCQPEIQPSKETLLETKKVIPPDLLDKASGILQQYGFTKNESQTLITDTYTKHLTTDTTELVKLALKTFGENQHGK